VKALVYLGAGAIEPRDIEVRSPSRNEVLLRVSGTGICFSDKHGHDYGWKIYRPGMVFGHEGAGVVAQLGTQVDGLSTGDLVAVDPRVYCGTCRTCRRGFGWACETRADAGLGSGIGTNALRQDGSFLHGLAAEYCTVPSYACYRLPSPFSWQTGACIETAAVGLHGARQSNIKVGDHVLLLGFDDYAMQMLRMLPPIRSVVVDPIAVRRDQASKFDSVRAVVDPSTVGWESMVLEALDGQADAVVVSMEDYIPEAGQYPKAAVNLVAPGGSVGSLRFYTKGGHGLSQVYRRFLAGVDSRQLGSFQSDVTPSGRSDYDLVIERASDGLDLSSHVSRVVPLSELRTQRDVTALFESLPSAEAKILIECGA
jgi:L-iditol 2-dehydrogenase